MPLNYPGPYQLRLFYTCNGTPGGVLTHSLRLNLALDGVPDVGDDFDTIDVLDHLGGTEKLDTIVDELIVLLKTRFNSAASEFTTAELWRYDDLTFEASYVAVYDVSVAGTSATSMQKTMQGTYTFRTFEGGIMRLVLLETDQAIQEPRVYGDLGSGDTDIIDYFLSATGRYFLAADTSYPAAFLRLSNSYNNATFRKRYRP